MTNKKGDTVSSRTLDEILTQAFTDGQSDTMWQDERHIEIFATAKAELKALIAEAKVEELRPLQASVDRDDLLLLIEERLAELDRLTQLKKNK